MDQIRVFTVEEANQLLPKLTELIKKLQGMKDKVVSLEVEIDAAELISGVDAEGHSAAVDKKMEEYNEVVNGFYDVIDEIHSHGCYLKDVSLGLIDFYMVHEEKVVYLCWKLGEERAEHWHEVGDGYASRQPLGPTKGESSS